MARQLTRRGLMRAAGAAAPALLLPAATGWAPARVSRLVLDLGRMALPTGSSG